MNEQEQKLWRKASLLAWFTILYNLAEGVISIFFGISDETLTLFGFGLDSMIESISASGILVMISRIKNNQTAQRTKYETVALKITGWCFYALSLLLAIGAVYSIYYYKQPESTVAGIIIALISIFSMLWLVTIKKKIGKKLNSAPIVSDANCNLVCLYMSIILLVASGLYYFFEIPYIDVLGSGALIFFSIKEGREAFAKAKSGKTTCSCHNDE